MLDYIKSFMASLGSGIGLLITIISMWVSVNEKEKVKLSRRATFYGLLCAVCLISLILTGTDFIEHYMQTRTATTSDRIETDVDDLQTESGESFNRDCDILDDDVVEFDQNGIAIGHICLNGKRRLYAYTVQESGLYSIVFNQIEKDLEISFDLWGVGAKQIAKRNVAIMGQDYKVMLEAGKSYTLDVRQVSNHGAFLVSISRLN